MGDLFSVESARARLIDKFSRLGSESVDIDDTLDRVLAQDIIASSNLPRFDNSAVDGFAVRYDDVSRATKDNPVKLPVVADIPAGRPITTALDSGQAMRIMTGAPLPMGADSIVPVEDTDFNNRLPEAATPNEVLIYHSPQRKNHIRLAGEDLLAGVHVYRVGDKLRPQDIGFLASLGYQTILVNRKPRIALFSSGDELVPLGEPLEPGKIYDSNSHMLQALIKASGGESIYLGSIGDRLEEVKSVLDRAVDLHVDLIISTAGVSVGAFDYVRQVIEKYGSLGFWRVNMRPGKPLVFGWYQDLPFIGLPGNPVSAFVGFMIFVRSAIAKMGGIEDQAHKVERIKLGEAVSSDGRESYLRARIFVEGGEKVAYLVGHQGSGNLFSLTQANALIIVPSGVKSLPAFSFVEAWSLGNL